MVRDILCYIKKKLTTKVGIITFNKKSFILKSNARPSKQDFIHSFNCDTGHFLHGVESIPYLKNSQNVE